MDFLFDGNKGIVDFSRCAYKPRKNEIRAKRLEWEHVMPVERFGRHLECWHNAARKSCMKDPKFNEMQGDLHNIQPAIGEVKGDRSNFSYSFFTLEHNQYGSCSIQLISRTENFNHL